MDRRKVPKTLDDNSLEKSLETYAKISQNHKKTYEPYNYLC